MSAWVIWGKLFRRVSIGIYGHFCEEKCTCDDNCDKENGCVQTTNETETLHSNDRELQITTELPDCQEKTPCLPFYPTIVYMVVAISVEAIVICMLIGTTILFARSRAHSWSLYSCPLPANTISLETQQEDDYTLLPDRVQLPSCVMNER
ncbi:uncharacterized protein LOC134254128 [Saccostrea cucullata]|uniref:uncharacterized protein LOC134254128 n=1 Tax=Saccostrea cuccullata TaxID=36930 RepID=UPI002ED3AAFC